MRSRMGEEELEESRGGHTVRHCPHLAPASQALERERGAAARSSRRGGGGGTVGDDEEDTEDSSAAATAAAAVVRPGTGGSDDTAGSMPPPPPPVLAEGAAGSSRGSSSWPATPAPQSHRSGGGEGGAVYEALWECERWVARPDDATYPQVRMGGEET